MVRAWAETALAGDPVDARALRILGQVAHAGGDEARARALMGAAGHRSVQDSWAAHWLLKDAYDRKDYVRALHYADVLLRTRTQALQQVLPVLGRMAETPEAVDGLEQLLAANPPWRRAFFSALPRAVTDARTPLRLLLAVRQTPDAPTLADIREYVHLLVQHKLYELAYYAWLQFLPASQLAGAGTLFNGGFELVPSGLPFDWSIRGGKGATAGIAARPDRPGERALLIALGPGRVDLAGAGQTLMLPPGVYRLQTRHRGELVGPRGLVWRIACADGGPPIGQSPMILGACAGLDRDGGGVHGAGDRLPGAAPAPCARRPHAVGAAGLGESLARRCAHRAHGVAGRAAAESVSKSMLKAVFLKFPKF